MEKEEGLPVAFAAIEKHDLKCTGMICTECGCVFTGRDEDTFLCEHLRKLAEECEDWVIDDYNKNK